MFHVKHEGWTPEELSSAQLGSLEAFEALLAEHAVPRGMVAASDLEHLRERHILDSLRAVPHLPPGALAVVDLGSGAGLPGIPVAIARQDLTVTLSEPRQARAAFLELVEERLELTNVRVFPKPAEELAPGSTAICFARGFRDPSGTWAIARDLLAPGGELDLLGGNHVPHGSGPAGCPDRRHRGTSS